MLHVVSNISVGNGIMAVLMNYYRNIDRSKLQFGFVYFDERMTTYEEEIINLGGKIYKLQNARNIIPFLKSKRMLANEIKNKYQILHIHDVFLVSFFLNVKKLWGIKKVIVHSHATKFSDSSFGEIRNRILSLPNYFYPDRHFACTRDAGIYAFGKKFDSNGFILKNAIDINKFSPNEKIRNRVRKELEVEDCFVVGHVGHFNRQKNHIFLINLFEVLCKEKQNAKLVLVSDGPYMTQIRELCKEKKIEDKVIFLGTRNDVPDIMKAFDCFVFPSKYEGLGIVLIEAQACGLHCVYSDVIPKDVNIINENNCILNLNDSYDLWTKAILENNSVAVDIINKRIENAGYNIKREGKNLYKIYSKIIFEEDNYGL